MYPITKICFRWTQEHVYSTCTRPFKTLHYRENCLPPGPAPFFRFFSLKILAFSASFLFPPQALCDLFLSLVAWIDKLTLGGTRNPNANATFCKSKVWILKICCRGQQSQRMFAMGKISTSYPSLFCYIYQNIKTKSLQQCTRNTHTLSECEAYACRYER